LKTLINQSRTFYVLFLLTRTFCSAKQFTKVSGQLASFGIRFIMVSIGFTTPGIKDIEDTPQIICIGKFQEVGKLKVKTT